MAVNCNDLGPNGSAFSLALSMRMEPAISEEAWFQVKAK